MFTEISQLVVTLVVLVGGGLMLWHGHLDSDTAGTVKTLIAAWSSFWLGAKVQRHLAPPTTTTTVLKPDGPVQTTVTPGGEKLP